MGGITSMLQGGKFGHGFVAAGLSTVAGQGMQDLSAPMQFMSRVVIGGTLSKATGGKFANGAASAAFAWVVHNYGKNLSQSQAHEGHSKNDPKDASHDFEVQNTGINLQNDNGVLKGEITYSCANSTDLCHAAAKQVLSINESESVDIKMKWVKRSGDIIFKHVDGVIERDQVGITVATAQKGKRSWFGLGKLTGSKITIAKEYANTPGLVLHEFGHLIGAPHQYNISSSIMSYGKDVRTNFSRAEIQSILEAY
jgi:hypothetical protein